MDTIWKSSFLASEGISMWHKNIKTAGEQTKGKAFVLNSAMKHFFIIPTFI